VQHHAKAFSEISLKMQIEATYTQKRTMLNSRVNHPKLNKNPISSRKKPNFKPPQTEKKPF